MKKDKLFIISYLLLSFIALTGSSAIFILNDITKVILYLISLVCLIIIIISSKLDIKKYIICICLFFVSIYAYFKIDTIFLLFTVLIIFSLKDINLKNVVKVDFVVKFVFIFVHILLFIFDNIFFNNSLCDVMIGNNGYCRYSLCFIHPNIASSCVFWLVVDYIYLKKQLKVKDYIFLILIILLTFILTKTRTLVLLYLILLLFQLNFVQNSFNIFINYIYKYIFEIFTIFTILQCYLYKIKFLPIYSFLNKLLSGRVYYSYVAMRDIGIKIFPSNVFFQFENIILDNFYIRCISIYGIIYLFFFFYLTKNDNNVNIKEKLLIIIFSLSLMLEYNAVIVGIAIPLLILGKNFYENNKNFKKSKLFNGKLSIIVPIYNMEKYLNKSIKSILDQKYKNIELILVDDGSSDKSNFICKSFCKKDKRVKLIELKNSGVSNARNIGIKNSSGDYITFVDPDDNIEIDMYETMIKNLELYGADISICGNKQVLENGSVISSTKKGELEILHSVECLKEILNEKKYGSCCWNKIFKKNILKKFKFNKLYKIGEDLDLIFRIFYNNYKVVYDSSPFYNWLVRQNSVTHDNFKDNISKWDSEIEICNTIIDNLKNNKLLQKYAIKRYVRINFFCYKNSLIYELSDKIKNKYKIELKKYYRKCLIYNFVDNIFKIKLLVILFFPKIIYLKKK